MLSDISKQLYEAEQPQHSSSKQTTCNNASVTDTATDLQPQQSHFNSLHAENSISVAASSGHKNNSNSPHLTTTETAGQCGPFSSSSAEATRSVWEVPGSYGLNSPSHLAKNSSSAVPENRTRPSAANLGSSVAASFQLSHHPQAVSSQFRPQSPAAKLGGPLGLSVAGDSVVNSNSGFNGQGQASLGASRMSPFAPTFTPAMQSLTPGAQLFHNNLLPGLLGSILHPGVQVPNSAAAAAAAGVVPFPNNPWSPLVDLTLLQAAGLTQPQLNAFGLQLHNINAQDPRNLFNNFNGSPQPAVNLSSSSSTGNVGVRMSPSSCEPSAELKARRIDRSPRRHESFRESSEIHSEAVDQMSSEDGPQARLLATNNNNQFSNSENGYVIGNSAGSSALIGNNHQANSRAAVDPWINSDMALTTPSKQVQNESALLTKVTVDVGSNKEDSMLPEKEEAMNEVTEDLTLNEERLKIAQSHFSDLCNVFAPVDVLYVLAETRSLKVLPEKQELAARIVNLTRNVDAYKGFVNYFTSLTHVFPFDEFKKEIIDNFITEDYTLEMDFLRKLFLKADKCACKC